MCVRPESNETREDAGRQLHVARYKSGALLLIFSEPNGNMLIWNNQVFFSRKWNNQVGAIIFTTVTTRNSHDKLWKCRTQDDPIGPSMNSLSLFPRLSCHRCRLSLPIATPPPPPLSAYSRLLLCTVTPLLPDALHRGHATYLAVAIHHPSGHITHSLLGLTITPCSYRSLFFSRHGQP